MNVIASVVAAWLFIGHTTSARELTVTSWNFKSWKKAALPTTPKLGSSVVHAPMQPDGGRLRHA